MHGKRFAVRDHVHRLDMTDRRKEQNAQIARFPQEQVSGEGTVIDDFALFAAAGGNNDVDRCVHRLNMSEAVVRLLQQVGQRGVQHRTRCMRLHHSTGRTEAARKRQQQGRQ